MAVAKSYEKYPIVKEPFKSEGKMYVTIQAPCSRCGGSGSYSYNQIDGSLCYGCMGKKYKLMNVRWYSDVERANMDRAAEARRTKIEEERAAKIAYRKGPMFNGFGDENGSIVVFGGDTYTHREELRSAGCRYNDGFGWYAPAGIKVETPEGCYAKTIAWSEVSKDNAILTIFELKAIVDKLFRAESRSAYQGSEGEKLTVNVMVKRNIELDGYYGISHMHIFEDIEGNVYVWTTAAKNISEGLNVKLTGTVKEHKEYNGTPQTVLTRCKYVEIDHV